jgi:hypothetical protein
MISRAFPTGHPNVRDKPLGQDLSGKHAVLAQNAQPTEATPSQGNVRTATYTGKARWSPWLVAGSGQRGKGVAD